jgi:hypothetical protein
MLGSCFLETSLEFRINSEVRVSEMRRPSTELIKVKSGGVKITLLGWGDGGGSVLVKGEAVCSKFKNY